MGFNTTQPLILAAATRSSLLWLGVILLFAVPLLGLVLLVRGLWGKHVGDEPRCRRCKYNLTGLPSNRCPECGADLDAPRATVIGLRQRRKAALIVGLFMVGLAAGGWGARLYARAKQIDPYPYYPTGWLVSTAAGGDSKALTELNARYTAGKLSDGQIAKFVTKGMEIQAAESKHALTRPWMTLLYQMILDDRASREQEDAFYRQLARCTISVRSPVRVGDHFVLETTWDFRIPADFPSNIVEMKVTAGDHIIGGRPDRGYLGPTIAESKESGSRILFDNATQDMSPGRYEVVYSDKMKISAPSQTGSQRGVDRRGQEPLVVIPLRTTTWIEILPAGSDELVTMVDRPDLRAQLSNMIEVQTVKVRHRKWLTQKNKVELNVEVIFGKGHDLPIGVAFDVIVLIGGEEHHLRWVHCNKGDGTNYKTSGNVPTFDDETVTIILRASRDAAKRSLDLYEIWDGELVYEGIAVDRPSER